MNINALPIRAYKGFNKDMTCNDFQYEQGKEYNCSDAILCETGFHACINPLEVWQYYPPTLMGCYCEVELSGFVDSDPKCSKICGTHIKIGREIDVSQMIDVFTEEYLERYYDEEYSIILVGHHMYPQRKHIKRIDSSHMISRRADNYIITNRSGTMITNKGHSGVIASNAERSYIYNDGSNVIIGNGGANSCINNFGHDTHIGNYAKCSTIYNYGDYSKISNNSDMTTIINHSSDSYIVSTGKYCQIYCGGERFKVNAVAGTTLICRIWNGTYKTFIVGENNIYPNVDYVWCNDDFFYSFF